MASRSRSRNPAALSYHRLRLIVGVIAISMPLVLAAGAIVLGLSGPEHALPEPLLQRSISDYYYTAMGDYLVGSLCVIAAFLMCSRGYDLHDEIAGYFAGVFTLGVAFFPSVNPRGTRLTALDVEIGFVHTGFAALMFLTLAYFCFFLFRRSSPDRALTRRKRHRNRIYGVCGSVIVFCMVILVSLVHKRVAQLLAPLHPLFCCESLALMAFGVAWLTKGEGILRDRPQQNHGQRLESVESR